MRYTDDTDARNFGELFFFKYSVVIGHPSSVLGCILDSNHKSDVLGIRSRQINEDMRAVEPTARCTCSFTQRK